MPASLSLGTRDTRDAFEALAHAARIRSGMLLADNAAPVLAAWASFYTTIGSSAAALTGLVFVVMTLITGERTSRPTHEGIATFSTPTVLHFGTALFISFVLNAPLHSLDQAAVLVGIVGLYGMVHIVQVVRRAERSNSDYDPDLEDRVYYVIAPMLSYGTIFAGSIEMFFNPVQALFVVASGVVVLVFIGIRNAWDVVTYLAVQQANEAADLAEGKKTPVIETP